jgi:DNA ligase-1
MNDSLHHGTNWDGRDLTGWAVSEKLDGCRGYWDGGRMWTRSGREIAIPERLRATLPGFPVDGELWAGRGQFSAASVAVRLGKWTEAARFVGFDAPEHPGTWTERMAFLHAHAPAIAAPFVVVGSTDEALEICADVLAQGGEGILARSPEDRFAPGRFSTLLKVKSARRWGLLRVGR